jgi:lipid-A-disaccharide synthase
VLMPEYLTCEDKSAQVAAHLVEWLQQPVKRERLVAEMNALKEKVGHGGASRRAAEYMLTELAKVRKPALRTHVDFTARGKAQLREAA